MKTNAIISISTMILPMAMFLMTLSVIIDPTKNFNQLVVMPLFWCGVIFAIVGIFGLKVGLNRANQDDERQDKQHKELDDDLRSLNRNLSNFVNEIRQERNERRNRER